MKSDRFWRAVAVLGLVLAGVITGLLLRAGTPLYGPVRAGGAASGGTIALTSDNGSTQQRLYLIDPEAKTILVYESRTGGGNFTLMCGRFYGHDAKLATLQDLPWNPRGYSVREVMNMLKKNPALTRSRR